MADRDLLLAVRVKLQEATAFARDARSVAASIRTMETATQQAGIATAWANTKSFLWRQTLFTLRRVMYSTTLAITGLATGAVGLGIAFNASMEQSTLAFGQFMGSTKAAKRELQFLFDLAARTPFSTENIRSAAQSFMAMGFSVRETNKYLTILGDVTAALPQLGGEGVQRLAIIFGQIRASGRLLGQDMLQLAQAGINVRSILQEQLHLTQTQMTAFMQGQLQIPSNVAIPAIMAGLQAKYKGMAKIQSGTFIGMISTAKDFAAQFLGVLTAGLFTNLEGRMRKVVDLIPKLQKAFGKNRDWDALFQTLDRGVGANGRIYEAFKRVRDISQSLGRIWRTALWPALKTVLEAIIIFVKVVGPPAIFVLRQLSHHTTLLRIALKLLAAYLIFTRAVALGLFIRNTRTAWILTNNFRLALYLLRTRGIVLLARALERLALERIVLQIRAARWATLLWTFAVGKLRQAWLLLNIAFVENPIGLIVVAILALYIGLGLLYFRWKKFHDFVNQHWRALALLIPVFGQIIFLFTHWRDILEGIWSLIQKIWGFFRHPIRAIQGWFTGADPGAARKFIPRQGGSFVPQQGGSFVPRQYGGIPRVGETTLVGEMGPELLHLPGSARVEPLGGSGGNLDRLPYAIGVAVRRALEDMKVVIDGRQVGKVVVKNVADQAARA